MEFQSPEFFTERNQNIFYRIMPKFEWIKVEKWTIGQKFAHICANQKCNIVTLKALTITAYFVLTTTNFFLLQL